VGTRLKKREKKNLGGRSRNKDLENTQNPVKKGGRSLKGRRVKGKGIYKKELGHKRFRRVPGRTGLEGKNEKRSKSLGDRKVFEKRPATEL